MTEQRFRGLFGLSLESVVPGVLEVSTDGTVTVELHDEVPGLSFEDAQAPTIVGEIAESTFAGPVVTLSGCFGTHQRFGTGGPLQRWQARLTFFGQQAVEPSQTFDRVTLEIDALDAFLNRAPRILKKGELSLPPPEAEAANASHGGHHARFLWRYTGQWGDQRVNLTRVPLVEVKLDTPQNIDDLLSGVVPVYEGLVTLALRRHAEVRTVRIGSPDVDGPLNVVAARVGGVAEERSVHPLQLLFRIDDLADLSATIATMQDLFSRASDFTAVFFSYERATSMYVEDRFRTAFSSLYYLLSASAANPTPSAPGFAPPELLTRVPTIAEDIARGPLQDVLGAVAGTLATRVIAAYRWTNFRDVASISGRELLDTGLHLRAVVHFLLLKQLGFDDGRAAALLKRAVEMRGL